jgi:hypothetical protein
VKLATLRDGSRDGQLMLFARDLKTAQLADGIAPTLQAALDDWAFIAPRLAALATQLDAGRAPAASVQDAPGQRRDHRRRRCGVEQEGEERLFLHR